MNTWERHFFFFCFLCILLPFVALYTFTGFPNTNSSELIDKKIDQIRRHVADRYLQRTARLDNVSPLLSGLFFTIAKRGYGDRAPTEDAICEVHYTYRFRCNLVFEDTRRNTYPMHRAPSQMIAGAKEAM
ncbi:unnamed protein product [Phytomonas sp. EM1]|nr:unnamed protein product [Phytomonas sp. EM1]|eukprot:CCW64691.1 unnamed protein product [Phytomonas sp. isolate EM1]